MWLVVLAFVIAFLVIALLIYSTTGAFRDWRWPWQAPREEPKIAVVDVRIGDE
jgi:hypothetical protein